MSKLSFVFQVRRFPWITNEKLFVRYVDARAYAEELAEKHDVPIWDPMDETPDKYEPLGLGVMNEETGILEGHEYVGIELTEVH